MSKALDPFDPENLRFAEPEIIGGRRLVFDKVNNRMVPSENLPAARNPKFKFCHWPIEGLAQLCANEQDANLAVLVHLTELWFSNFKRNPVKLGRVEIKGLKVAGHKKARALVALEKAGLISVNRQTRKSPHVTLNWLPLLK